MVRMLRSVSDETLWAVGLSALSAALVLFVDTAGQIIGAW